MSSEGNKLPTFCETGSTDATIVDNTSTLKSTGFVPNSLIESSQMNTYLKMMVNGLNGIVDGIYQEGMTSGAIKADSSIEEWSSYLKEGLSSMVKSTVVDKATEASKLGSTTIGSTSKPIYIDKGTATEVGTSLDLSITGNAATTSKLKTGRTISLTGDVAGNATFDGSQNISILTGVAKAEALKSTNVGSDVKPVYFGSDGKPTVVNMYQHVGDYTMTYYTTGVWSLSYANITDKSKFLALIYVYVGNNKYYLGVCQFNNGHIDSESVCNTCIVGNTTSSSDSIIGATLYAYKSGVMTYLQASNIYSDLSIVPVSSSTTVKMTIYKLYEI